MEIQNPNLLLRLDPRHMQIPNAPSTRPLQNGSDHFMQMVNQGFTAVENLDHRANQLTKQSVFDPDSVEAHEVIISAQKARFALNLTRTLAEGFVRSYRELTSLR